MARPQTRLASRRRRTPQSNEEDHDPLVIVALSISHSREKGEAICSGDNEYSPQGGRVVNSERRAEQGGLQVHAGRGAVHQTE